MELNIFQGGDIHLGMVSTREEISNVLFKKFCLLMASWMNYTLV